MPDTFRSQDPATELVLRDYAEHDAAEVERRVAAAAAAQASWRATPLEQRIARIRELAGELRTRRAELALLASREMGKLIGEAESEVDKCAKSADVCAEHAAAWLAHDDTAAVPEARVARVQHEPLGLVLAIMPWNFPYWQVLRCALPALLAGNGVLVKHAPNVQGCAEALESACARALPRGLVANLRVSVERIESLCADRRVAALSLTGSTRAGASAAALAGKHTKPIVLELGGSDPFVVLADADLERASAAACTSRMINAGQSCIAAKRCIVEAPLYEAFVERLARAFGRLRVGSPLERDTTVAPLARADLRAELERQIETSVRAGARVVVGGARSARAGWFHAPTLLADVTREMSVFREETFGPLAVLVRARDAEHALELANDTRYGLAASLWTQSARGLELASRIEAGAVFVNEFARSDARLPFGGIKDSGFGRELGRHGFLQFTNAKTVWVA